MNTEETVTIPKKAYESLLDDSDRYDALCNAGVDNWEWYDEAMKEYHKAKNDRGAL